MKKIYIGLIILASLFVASCSSSGSKEKTTLRYGIWSNEQKPVMEEMVKRFEESHPNIEVKIEVTPNEHYWTKMDAAAQGNSLPDVFWMHGTQFHKYASNDAILSVQEQIKSDDVDMDNYYKELVDLYTHNEEIYGLPRNYNLIGLWYNKELFDEANVDYPDENWDWDKLRSAAKKLTDSSEDVWGIASHLASQEGWYNTVYQANGYILSDDKKSSGYDQPETIKGIKFWTDLIHEHNVSPTFEQQSETSPVNMFTSEKVAMYYGGDWEEKTFLENDLIKDKIDVAVLPKGDKRATVMHGSSNVIASNTEHEKEAWELVKFLSSREASEIQAKKGSGPPAYKDLKDVYVESHPQYNMKAFVDGAEYAKTYPVSEKSPEWEDLQFDYFKKAYTGEKSIEETSKELSKEMNDILQD